MARSKRNIAIGGPMCAGKSAIAECLVANHGYTKVSLAAGVREIAGLLYGGGGVVGKSDHYTIAPVRDDQSPLDFRSPFEVTGRELLQRVGSAFKTVDRYVWVDWLLNGIGTGAEGNGPFVLDDLRFTYEAERLAAKGWLLAVVDTPMDERLKRHIRLYGRTPSMTELSHPSETEWEHIEPDYILHGEELEWVNAQFLAENAK